MTPARTHIRIALRMLGKRPGLAAGRLLTVTIVVAAVSAVFTVANATFLRPLPFPNANRLVLAYMMPPGRTEFRDANPFTPRAFDTFRRGVSSLERVEGIWALSRAVGGDAEPEAVVSGRVSAGFFAMFGGRVALGRVFTEEEAVSDAKVAVLGHGLWQRRFAGDPNVLGRTMIVDGEAHEITGVMSSDFEPAFVPSEFWTPLSIRNPNAQAFLSSVRTFGVLRPGVTVAQAMPDMERMLGLLKADDPTLLKGWTSGLKPLREAQFGQQGPAVLMLLAAVTALGLIAIANLANLTLADVMFRRGDFAVRAALGASRLDIAAEELAQAFVLAAAGGAAGLALAVWLVPALLALDSTRAITAAQAPLDWRVAACGFGVAGIVMILAVAAPIVRLAGPGLAADITAGSRRTAGGRAASRTRVVLVAAQTALALLLLSAGAQIVTALLASGRAKPGFDPSGLVTGQLRLSANAFPEVADRARFVERVIERLLATPGVTAAGTTLNSFTVNGAFTTLVDVEDRPSATGEAYAVQYRRVSPGYFDAMRIAVVRGRAFDRRDTVDAPLVAIVSRGFARRFWGEDDPIGRHVRRGVNQRNWITVVGVVDDVRDVGLNAEPADTLYTPYYQGSSPAAPVGVVVRTNGDPRGMVTSIRRAIWDVDPKQPLANVVTMEQFLSDTLGAQRFRALLVSACGAIGFILAIVGTYGVTARSVVERTREVGIRLALGGAPLRVWWTVAWGSLRAVVAGAVLGIVLSGAASALLAALLPEVQQGAWGIALISAAALATVGGAASLIAARAAIAVEPVRALKDA